MKTPLRWGEGDVRYWRAELVDVAWMTWVLRWRDEMRLEWTEANSSVLLRERRRMKGLSGMVIGSDLQSVLWAFQ
jgi:hypothetical protein